MGLHGHSSAGKTTLITTLPNTLLIRPAIEHTESVKNPAPGVQEWIVRSWEEMSGEVLDYLMHEGHKHSFVWLDSVSGWQDVGLDEVWRDVLARYPHRKGTPIDKGDYNKNFVQLAQWVRAVVGMDAFNFGFTAWPEELEDEEGNTRLMPWVQGKNMANRFVGYMKVVGYLERVESRGSMRRVLRFDESPKYFTKDQIGLPDRIVDPTMEKFMEAVKTARSSGKSSNKPARTTRRRRTTARKGSSK